MARAPRNYKVEYARRVANATGGYSPAEARARGISVQKARGHQPREKARTIERQRARNPAYLTETDRRFLRKQLARTGDRYRARRTGTGRVYYELEEDRVTLWERQREAYIALNQAQRFEIRRFQQGVARAKRHDPHFQLDQYVGPNGETWEKLMRNMPTIIEQDYDILGVPLIFYTPV